MPDDPEFATPSNFLDDPCVPSPPVSDSQRLRRKRLEALGLSPDELFARVVDLESDLMTSQAIASVALTQLQAAEAHKAHLTGRIKQLLAEIRKLAETRR